MNKVRVAVGGTVLMIVLSVVLGYLAWTNYSSFYDSMHMHYNDNTVHMLFPDWTGLSRMAIFMFFSGFVAGISVAIVQMARTFKRDAEREQEKERMKEEIKKEPQIQKQ